MGHTKVISECKGKSKVISPYETQWLYGHQEEKKAGQSTLPTTTLALSQTSQAIPNLLYARHARSGLHAVTN